MWTYVSLDISPAIHISSHNHTHVRVEGAPHTNIDYLGSYLMTHSHTLADTDVGFSPETDPDSKPPLDVTNVSVTDFLCRLKWI